MSRPSTTVPRLGQKSPSLHNVCVIAAFLLLGFSPATTATETMRCGNRLIVQGDSISKVRDLCGEPEDITYAHIMRRPSYVIDGRRVFFGDETVEVRVENWIYNFGPNKFMRRLKFVDGILEEVESLNYGHHPN